MSVAKIIREKRKSKGLSKKDLAALLGISEMHVYDLEAYENEVEDTLNIRQIIKLAELIQIQPGILCSELQLFETPSEQAFKEIKNKIKKSNIPLERLSEKIGWDLGLCAKSLESIKEQPVMFFQDFAKFFKLPIGQILPK